MNTNQPRNRKGNFPTSDQTSRSKHADLNDDASYEKDDTPLAGLQTSNNSGKHSSVEKLGASRPEYGSGRGAQNVPGAFGDDPSHLTRGREAAPNTNQFRCSGCGRYLNTAADLSVHELDCRNAKASTESGRKNLEHEDEMPHARNDADR